MGIISDSEIKTLAQRIDHLTEENSRLERSICSFRRRGQLVGLACVGIACAIFFIGANSPIAHPPIQTSQLDLVNETGKVRASLFLDKKNGLANLAFYDLNGKPEVRVGYYEGNGPMVVVESDPAGGLGHLATRYRWDGLNVYREEGSPVSLGLDSSARPKLVIRGGSVHDPQQLAELTTDGQGAKLELSQLLPSGDKSRNLAVLSSEGPDASLALSDVAQNKRVFLSVPAK